MKCEAEAPSKLTKNIFMSYCNLKYIRELGLWQGGATVTQGNRF